MRNQGISNKRYAIKLKFKSFSHTLKYNYYKLKREKGKSYQAYAGVVELVDTRDLKSRAGNCVPVRLRSPAPYKENVDYWPKGVDGRHFLLTKNVIGG